MVDRFYSHMIPVSKTTNMNITTPTIIHAAWALLMSKYEQSNTVVIGVTVAGRNAPVSGIEDIIGPTIATMPIRVNIDPGQRIGTYLEAIQKQSTTMIPFEQYGLQNIRALSAETQSACEFQNLLVIHPTIWRKDIRGIGTAKLYSNELANDKTYPLVMECTITTDGIQTMASFDCKMADEHRIGRVTGQFEHVLKQLLSESSEVRVGDVRTLSQTDQRDIWAWNRECPEAVDACVHEVVAQQVLARPDVSAVCGWDASFSYRELDELSTRLAHRLVGLGVGPEMFVPLCFEKSAWAIVAMLAVLKAGGAYVSLNPSHPMSRNQDMICELSASVLLTGSSCNEKFGTLVPHTICVSWASVEHLPAVKGALRNVAKDNTAFIVFASGSTGKPKGIVMNHGAFCSSSKAHAAALCITRESRVMQFASYTYDVSMGEIFTTLMHGGCVCVPSEEDRLNNLARAINNMNANWLFLTPTVAGILRPPSVPRLKVLVLGGEHATTDNVKTWANQVTLINSYGPAECAIWASCTAGLEVGADPANLGRRVGGIPWVTEVNDSNKLSPIGCVGELLIEGPILARGYLNDPEKTAAAFIEDPPWAEHFGPGRRRRFYKTGDLVRYNSDGTLNFIGRKDTHVKLHGQRLELGEVEHHLKSLAPSDWQVTVEMIQPASCEGNPILAGFVCVRDKPYDLADTDLALSTIGTIHEKLLELEAALAAQLPSYMVPAAYIPLQHLPLTSSGKTDRQKLRQLGSRLTAEQLVACSVGERTKRAPSTEIEVTLQQLWADVLHLEPSSIGADDSFFRLGGDSIKAMRLVAAARGNKVFLNVAGVLLKPRLWELALLAGDNEQCNNNLKAQQASLSAFTSIDNQLKQSLNNAACAQAFVSNAEVEEIFEATSHQIFAITTGLLKSRGSTNYFTFKFDSTVDKSDLERACRRLVEHHQILRTVFIVHHRRVFQVVLRSPRVEFHQYKSCSRGEEVISELIDKDRAQDVKLGQLMVRFMYVDYGTESSCLIFRMSHAQYDGVCLPTIYKDLKAAYIGEELSKGLSFVHFVSGVRRAQTAKAEAFWTSRLDGSSMTQFLSRSEPPLGNDSIRFISRAIPSVSLNTYDVTLASVIKTAWALIQAGLSGQKDVVFGHVISGRNLPLQYIDSIVGDCVNCIPVRVEISSTTVLDLLKQVQEEYLSSIPFESLSLGEIVEKCTNWPCSTRFSSIIQHQNLDEIVESLSFGNATCTVGLVNTPVYASDIFMVSNPRGSEIEVSLTWNDEFITQNFAEGILEKLCFTVLEIVSDPYTRVSSLSSSIGLSTCIPFSVECDNSEPTSSSHISQLTNLASTQLIVNRAWSFAMDSRDGISAKCKDTNDTPFFDTWEEVIIAARFVEFYNLEGISVTMEEIIEHPTINLQCLLVESRIGAL